MVRNPNDPNKHDWITMKPYSDTFQCNTASCDHYQQEHCIPDGTAVYCGGQCGNLLRGEDPTHPDFPVQEEPEETLEDMIRHILQEELSKVNTDSGTIEEDLEG